MIRLFVETIVCFTECCWCFNVGIYRLDRLTSGIIIFSKTEAKTKELMELMQKRQLQKEYVCRVDGEFPW